MLWTLTPDFSKPTAYVQIARSPRVPLEASFLACRPITVPLPEPLVFETLPLGDDERDTFGDVIPELPSYFEPAIPLVSVDLLAAIEEGGGQDMQTFRAELREVNRGESLAFVAINVTRSVPLEDVRAETVSHPIFRYAHDYGGTLTQSSSIVVNDAVRAAILRRGIPNVTLEPLVRLPVR